MNDPTTPGAPSDEDLGNVTVKDDLSATGAALTLVGNPVVTTKSGDPIPYTYTKSDPVKGGLLTFEFGQPIPAGDQVEIKITVVLDSTNVVGTSFTNRASWDFSRWVDVDQNGIKELGITDSDGDGTIENEMFDPLPGEGGEWTTTISGPDLKVTKSGTGALGDSLNLGQWGTFYVDVANVGDTDAWNIRVLDRLPYLGLHSGMCEMTPQVQSVEVMSATGTLLRTLTPTDQYLFNFSGVPTCTFTIDLLDAAGAIRPGEYLHITYQSKLDPDTPEGTLYNIAGATHWYNDASTNPDRVGYTGTVSTDPVQADADSQDEQDAHPIVVTYSGYFFEKTAVNATPGKLETDPYEPGDTVRYKLRLWSLSAINNFRIYDDLDALNSSAAFQAGTLVITRRTSSDPNIWTTALDQSSATGGSKGTGVIDISNLNLAAGGWLEIEFTVNLAWTLAGGAVVDNQARTFLYDATSHTYTIPHALSDDPGINGQADPAVSGDEDPTRITIYVPPAPTAPTKVLVSPTAIAPAVPEATIGQEVVYRITVPGTPDTRALYDVAITDQLDPNLEYVSATVTGVLSSNVTDHHSASLPSLMNIGISEIPAGQQAVVELHARVANVLSAQENVPINNTASYTYRRLSSSPVQPALTSTELVTVNIAEPHISTIVKTPSTPTPLPGGIVRYSVTLTARSGADSSDVFDVALTDTLGSGLAYYSGGTPPTVTAGSGVGADNTIGAPVITGTGTTADPYVLTWSLALGNADIDIAEGESVTISYDVRVQDTALAGQTLTNSVVAQWTSLDGVPTIPASERTGADGIGGLNDYVTAAATTSVTTPDTNNITKDRSGDTYGGGAVPEDVRIGDIVDYTLTLSVQEGTLGNLVLVDTLPKGLEFLGIVSINGQAGPTFTAAAPFSHADITAANVTESGDPAVGPTTVTWNLGTVTNTLADGLNNDFVIVYRARVLNNHVLTHTAAAIPLNNSVEMNYDAATGRVTKADLVTQINVQQPMLNVIKSSDPVSGSGIEAGVTVTYTVDIQNIGGAPAYDVVLRDLIPLGMRVGGVTMVSTTLLSGGGQATRPYSSYDPATGEVIWDFDSNVANEYTIPAGDTLRVVYRVVTDAGLAQNVSLTNYATVDLYYSLDDEAVPTGGAVNWREVYGPTATASTVLYTGSQPTKILVSPPPTNPEATIGQDVIYRITVPGTAVDSPMYDVDVTDLLAQNLAYVGVTVTGGGTGVIDNYNASSAPDLMNVRIGTIPAGQQVFIDLHTRVANVPSAQQAVTVDNTASYDYANTPGGSKLPALTSGAVAFHIIEPQIMSISKVADKATAAVGDVVRYTVTMTARSGTESSDVFDVTLTDSLPPGLAYDGSVPPTVTVTAAGTSGASNTIGAPSITGDGSAATPQTLVWSLGGSVPADIDIPEGATVSISYGVRVLDNVLPNQALTNSAVAQWTSLDGISAPERTGIDGAGGLNDYVTGAATATVTTGDNNSIAKARTADTYAGGTAPEEVRVGDVVDYTLTLSMQEGTLGNVVLVDTLPKGLVFEGIVSINGDAGSGSPTTYSQVAPFVHNPISATNVTVAGDPATGPTTVTWNLGSITNTHVDGANNDFVIVYRARVLNNDVLAHSATGLTLTNSVTMTYATGSTPVTKSAETAITVQQPMLAVTKSSNPVDGSSVAPGQTVTYTVDIQNTGGAPAYDVVLEDIIPVGMRAAGVTMVSTYLLSSPTPGLPTLVPAFDAGIGTATWDFNSGVYAIPAHDTLRVVYSVVVDAGVGENATFTNYATVNRYYSFDDGAAPVAGTVTGQREQYGPTNTGSTTLYTGSRPTKVLVSPAPTSPQATIGQEVIYQITVPGTAGPRDLHDVEVTDQLESLNLEYISADVTGVASWTNTSTITPSVMAISIPTIPAGSRAVINVHARVRNVSAVQDTAAALNNTASYTYAYTSGGAVQPALTSAPVALTIIEPHITTIVKSATPTTLVAGDTVHYTVTLTARGGSPTDTSSDVYDVTLVDTLGAGLEYIGPATVNGTGNTIGAPQITVDPLTTQQTLVWSLANSTDIDIPEGTSVTIGYDVRVRANVLANQPLTNTAVAQWTSIDGALPYVENTFERDGADGIGGLNDYVTQPYTLTLTAGGAVLTSEKRVERQVTDASGTTSWQSGTTASPGDRLRYTITVRNTTQYPLTDFNFIDEIDRLNNAQYGAPMFDPASISNVVVSTGDPYTINNGTLTVTGLDIGAYGTVSVTFEALLVPVIPNGTIVLNQGQLSIYGTIFNNTDDPLIAGVEDPTETLISSAPVMRVNKTSEDITDPTTELMAGDTLRYTITVQNVGTENAAGVTLRDQIPVNTTYVPHTTYLNGVLQDDLASGGSPLETGMLVHAPAPESQTPGDMRADASGTTANVATITFQVRIDPNVINGTVISNQGVVTGTGTSGDVVPETRSDDPDTPAAGDPTIDVVGNLPSVDVQKTVTLAVDQGQPGVDAGDKLHYTITIVNRAATPATGVVLTDQVPANTTYVANSVFLNGEPVAQPDGGVSPLAAGIAVSSDDLTPPVPTGTNGVVSGYGTAVVTFDVTVNPITDPTVTYIRNQGTVSTNEQPDELTDADGDDSNDDQPTDIGLGNTALLTIVKTVQDLNGGTADPGDILEYTVTVTNNSTVASATPVVITDDLSQLGNVTYVPAATLNGSTNGVQLVGTVLTADYSGTYGPLLPQASAVLRFQVQIGNSVAPGTHVNNTARVDWGTNQSSEASVAIDVGGMEGSAILSGVAWHDGNLNRAQEGGENPLAGWSVEIYRGNGVHFDTVTTDSTGAFRIVAPPDVYELRFVAPAGGSTAMLGWADSAYTNGQQRISTITATSGSNVLGLNLPLQPNGVVYNSVTRSPVAGATLKMVRASDLLELSNQCFEDPAQQGQVTGTDGFYKFDIKFGQADCAAPGDYLIQVTPPATGYVAGPSLVIPPSSGETTTALDVPACPGSTYDALPGTNNLCEIQSSASAPGTSVPARTTGTNYYLKLTLDQQSMPVAVGDQVVNQPFNNHIPLDPELNTAVNITKTAGMVNVTRGQLVPYTITLQNTLTATLTDMSIVDTMPAGFKYVKGSARLDGKPVEPVLNGRALTWASPGLATEAQHTIKLLLVVGSGVTEGEYVNHAQVFNLLGGGAVSGDATATVRVTPDATFDCTDITGKVFDDVNLNGYQDEGEPGLAGVRIVSARGLIMTTDQYGRYHVTCAAVPDEDRGSNFVLKVDDRSLPTGYRVVTENPLVQRVTRGKMLKFNFGAAIHRVVSLSIADGVFEPGSTDLRIQWKPRLDSLLEQLKKSRSVLRISYLADVEQASLVDRRIKAIKKEVADRWKQPGFPLSIETEIFWRRGGPPERR